MTMRKSTFEIGLELDGAADHMPRAVFELRIQQIFDAALVGRAGRRNARGFMQRVKRLAGGVGVTRETGALSPATVGLLLREQLLALHTQRRLIRITPGETEQLHYALLVLFWFDADQPCPSAFDPLRCFPPSAWQRVLLNGPDRISGI